MGRRSHLELTLPTLYKQADEHIIVDYSCPDKSGDWVEANYPGIKVVRVPDQKFWNLPKAKNAGAAAATSEWICFIDADSVVAPNFIKAVKYNLKEGVIVTRRCMSLGGFIAMQKSVWEKVKYNEAMEGWCDDDTEFIDGVKQLGLIEVQLPGYIGAIEHTDFERTKYNQFEKGKGAGISNGFRRWKSSDPNDFSQFQPGKMLP
jgi:glycosyltransferase involved in cell wall biosynthesis